MEQTANNGHKQGEKALNTPSTKPRKARYLTGLPSVASTQDQQKVIYNMNVDKTPTEFNSLDNYEVFSMTNDGSSLMFKISKSRAVRLSDRKTFSANGGRVHKVTLQSHYLNIEE
ncbi:MAG: hypothetical protein QNJ36_08995 [Calothrix sp. MO_167.B42]|nr:hypothetical protein [Calothrix sp. MO_167.B42]